MLSRNFHFVVFISIALVGLSVLAMALLDHYSPDKNLALSIVDTQQPQMLMNDGSFMPIEPGELRHGNVSRCGKNKLCGPHGPVTLPYPHFPIPPAPASLEVLYQSLLFEQGEQEDPETKAWIGEQFPIGTIHDVPLGLRSDNLPEGGPVSADMALGKDTSPSHGVSASQLIEPGVTGPPEHPQSPPGLRAESLPEGGPASADVKLNDSLEFTIRDGFGNIGIGLTQPLHPLVIQDGLVEILRVTVNGDIFLRGEKIGHDDYIVRELRAAYSQVTRPSLCTGRDQKARWQTLQEEIQRIDPTGKRVRIDPETGDLGIGTAPPEAEVISVQPAVSMTPERPPGLRSEPLHGDESIEGPTPKIMLNVINPPGLRYEPLPEGGPGSADLKITDMSVQGNVDPPGPNQIFVVDGNPLSSGPSVEIGEAITLEPLFHMQKSQPIIFFGTTEQDAPLVIHPDGRVLRYGRDLGTDPEIFKALQRALFNACPPLNPDKDRRLEVDPATNAPVVEGVLTPDMGGLTLMPEDQLSNEALLTVHGDDGRIVYQGRTYRPEPAPTLEKE